MHLSLKVLKNVWKSTYRLEKMNWSILSAKEETYKPKDLPANLFTFFLKWIIKYFSDYSVFNESKKLSGSDRIIFFFKMRGLKVSPYLHKGLMYIKKDLCNKINQTAFMIGSVGI